MSGAWYQDNGNKSNPASYPRLAGQCRTEQHPICLIAPDNASLASANSIHSLADEPGPAGRHPDDARVKTVRPWVRKGPDHFSCELAHRDRVSN